MRSQLFIVETLVLFVGFGGATTNITTCTSGAEINGGLRSLLLPDPCLKLNLSVTTEHLSQDSDSDSLKYVQVNGSNGEIFYFHIFDSICYPNSSREQVLVATCDSACNPNHPKSSTRWSPFCISKCCPLGSRLDIQSGSCIQMTQMSSRRDAFFDAIKADNWIHPNFFYDPDLMSCRREFTGFRMKFLTKCELVALVSNQELETTRQPFCLDLFLPPDIPGTFQNDETIAVAMMCLMDRSTEHLFTNVSTTIFLSLITAFHCCIVAAHVIVWAHQDCYGWTVMVCSGTQLTMGVSAVCAWTIWRNSFDPTVALLRFCGVSVVVMTSTYLASFTWTMLLAYELWRKTSFSSAPGPYCKRRFVIYCLVGFIPALLVTSFKVSNFFTQNPLAEFHDACNFYFETTNIYIEVLPAVFFYASIITFGALTLKRMRELRLSRLALGVLGKQQRPLIRRVKLIWKLMGILGGFFITDILCELWSKATDQRHNHYRYPLQTFSKALMAFAQFHIFVCSGNTRDLLIKRLPGLEKYLDFCRNVASCALCKRIFKKSNRRVLSVLYISNPVESNQVLSVR